jgi:enoyl-CoA hydratase/carnithine racemase
MLNPDKQTVANLKALLKTTIAAVHGVSSSDGLELALGFEYLIPAAGALNWGSS